MSGVPTWVKRLSRDELEKRFMEEYAKSKGTDGVLDELETEGEDAFAPSAFESPYLSQGRKIDKTSSDLRRDTSTQILLENYMALERGQNAFTAPKAPAYVSLASADEHSTLEYGEDCPAMRRKIVETERAVGGLREHMSQLAIQCSKYCSIRVAICRFP